MLRKTKTHNMIEFISNNNKLEKMSKEIEEEKKIKEEKEIKDIEVLAEEQKSRKINYKDNGYMSTKSIMSTGYGTEKDQISSNKFVNNPTLNSIWGQREFKDSPNVPQIKKDKIELEIERENKLAKKREQDAQRMKDIPALSKEVVSSDNKKNYGFRPYQTGISIFDDSNFGKLPEKTAGEQLSDEIKQKQSEKDESWKNGGKVISSKNMTNNLFNNLNK